MPDSSLHQTWTTRCCWLALTVALLAGACRSQEVNTTRLQEVMTTLARQTMMQQLSMEERIRSSGHSGIKQIRFNKDGTRALHTSSHIGENVASIHNHADHYKTVGIGEFVGVLNGVDFRSRHNDYMLKSPSKNSQDYRATDDIEYPDVPPEVLDAGSVEEQIEEMRLWFKAWADQDSSRRDYTQYFKSLLCYLEGAWTETDFGQVQEPFESDRHHISADNWYDLQEKIRYTAYTGSKDKGENYAFLPTKIMDIDLNTKEPIYAQWNYRILCHPLKKSLQLSYLWPTGDFHYRFARGDSYKDYARTRASRFLVEKRDRNYRYRWHVLENMMREIPGLNNYPADLRDESFGRTTLNPFTNGGEVLNAGYYHRWYRAADTDAMGLLMGHRGFSDRNLFVAFTNQSEVSPVSVKYCENGACDTNTARVSYAIPLEIVYLTPLHKWNPYNITLWSDDEKDEATRNRRNGGFSPSTAYNGVNSRHYYRTPQAFFSEDQTEVDAADTADEVCGVLDPSGNVQNVSASGVRIFLPEIPGITGNLRTRFPIFPIHEEGSTAYKEVEALREMMMDMAEYLELFKKVPPMGSGIGGDSSPDNNDRPDTILYTSDSTKSPIHKHTVTLTYMEYVRVKLQGKAVEKTSSKAADHTHVIRVTYDKVEEKFRLFRCDKAKYCWDGHGKYLELGEDDEA